MRRLYFGAMSAKGTPREGMGTPRESPRGSPEAEEAIAGIHKAHELPKAAAAKPLPAKSTVGIVLEGCSVNICVPGSPSSKDVRDPMQEQADCDAAFVCASHCLYSSTGRPCRKFLPKIFEAPCLSSLCRTHPPPPPASPPSTTPRHFINSPTSLFTLCFTVRRQEDRAGRHNHQDRREARDGL